MGWTAWFSQRKVSMSLLLTFLTLALIGSDSLYALVTGTSFTDDTLIGIGLFILLLTTFATVVLETRQTAIK